MADSHYYMPPATYRRDGDARTGSGGGSGSAPSTHMGVKRESTWRPGAASAASSGAGASTQEQNHQSTAASSSSSSRPTNAWASRDSPRGSSPGPSQSYRARNDAYYEPPAASSTPSSQQRSLDRGAADDRHDGGRNSDRRNASREGEREREPQRDFRAGERDRNTGGRGDDGWKKRGRDNDDRGSWADYRQRMATKHRAYSPDDRDRARDRDDRGRGGWGARRRDNKDIDDRRWGGGRADDRDRDRDRDVDRDRNGRDRDQSWGRNRSAGRAASPEDQDRRGRSPSRSRSRERSPPPRGRRHTSVSDSESDGGSKPRRGQNVSSPHPSKRRQPPSPRLPDAKRARDYSPPRRGRSPNVSSSRSRSRTPPPRRAVDSPPPPRRTIDSPLPRRAMGSPPPRRADSPPPRRADSPPSRASSPPRRADSPPPRRGSPSSRRVNLPPPRRGSVPPRRVNSPHPRRGSPPLRRVESPPPRRAESPPPRRADSPPPRRAISPPRRRDSPPPRRDSPPPHRGDSPPPRRTVGESPRRTLEGNSASTRNSNSTRDRSRSPDSPPRAYGPRADAGRWERERDRPMGRQQRPLDRPVDRGGDRDRDFQRDRWQPLPPRDHDNERFGNRQQFSQGRFSQGSTRPPVKMRQWGHAPSRSPSPTPRRRSPSPSSRRTTPSPPPRGSPPPLRREERDPRDDRDYGDLRREPPSKAQPTPTGFRRPPPTGPRGAAPPTGPAADIAAGSTNGHGTPARTAFVGGWHPVQRPAAPAPPPTRDSVPGHRANGSPKHLPQSPPLRRTPPSPRRASPPSTDVPEIEMEDVTSAPSTMPPSVPQSPKRFGSGRWNRGKSTPQSGDVLQSKAYLDRLADKERQYDQHLSTIAPYIAAAFARWYSQHATPALPDFLVHYFGRPPSKVELDQVHQLLQRRTQLARDQTELRHLHEQALQIEARVGAAGGGADTGPSPAPTSSSDSTAAPAMVSRPSTAQHPITGEAYERLSQVGEGTYGKVYKARNVGDGSLVALKRIRMEQEKDGFPVTSMREIKLLQALHHPNVVRLREMMVSKGSVYMVLEYMNHDLTGILSHPEVSLSEANIKSLNHQMLSGLGYLHQRGILHRDMKGSNILLNGAGELKLADFGLARWYHKHKRDDYTNRVITLWYRSPELLMGETCYGPEVDTWSAGCIMLEIFTSKPVFQGSDEINQLEVIYSVLGTPDTATWAGITELPWYELVRPRELMPSRFRAAFGKWLSPGAADVVEGLLCFNPAKRLLADAALAMPYFASEEPAMVRPTQLAECGEHHEMSVKLERHRRRGDKSATSQQ